MGTVAYSLYHFKDGNPAALAGFRNVKWQKSAPYLDTVTVNGQVVSVNAIDISAYEPNIGGVNEQSGTSYTIQASDRGILVVLTNAASVAITLDSTLPNDFYCAVLFLGAAGGTMAASSGTLRPPAAATMVQYSAAWVFFGGTNWSAILGTTGGGGSGTVTHTAGALTSGQIIEGNGGADIKVGDLTGDVTTSGTMATTVAKIQGTTVTGTTGSGAAVLGTAPTLSNPVVGTQSPGDNSTKAASTAFVTAAVSAGGFTNGTLGIVIDGGPATPTTGSKGFVQAPYDCTIVSWTMLGNVAGAAQITVKKSTYAAFPTTASIVAAAPPNIAATNQKNTSSSLGTWTTTVTKGDILEFNLDSVTSITRITLQLQVTRSD